MSSDSRPYRLHTNRELGMMLRGEKPLAHFADGEGAFPECVLRYLRMFDRHVAAGRFIRRDVICPPDKHRSFALHRLLIALPGEEWRIDAMLELMASPEWSASHERREGELLGYTDLQNEWHIAKMYS